MNIAQTALLSYCLFSGSTFYDRILDDHDDYSFFVALNVKSDSFSGRVIIQNRDLFDFLSESKRFTKDEYKAFMKDLLLNRHSLLIRDEDLAKRGFTQVSSTRTVAAYASKGRGAFIRRYFVGRTLKHGVSAKERDAVINRLFEWEVAARIDDETGYLYIVR